MVGHSLRIWIGLLIPVMWMRRWISENTWPWTKCDGTQPPNPFFCCSQPHFCKLIQPSTNYKGFPNTLRGMRLINSHRYAQTARKKEKEYYFGGKKAEKSTKQICLVGKNPRRPGKLHCLCPISTANLYSTPHLPRLFHSTFLFDEVLRDSRLTLTSRQHNASW